MANVETVIDRAKDITICNVKGEVTIDEIYAVARTYLSDIPTNKVLWNFCEADGSEIPTADFRKFHSKIARLPNIPKDRKVAVVVSSAIGFGLSRLSAAYAESAGTGARYSTFRSLEDAMQWLEQSDD
jgi:hypothetical protein